MVGRNLRACVWRGVAIVAVILLMALGLSGELKAARAAQAQPQAQTAAGLEVVPSMIHFQEVPAGETYTQTVRLANLGNEPLEVKKITLDAPGFAVSGFASPLVLPAGGTTNITVSYNPRKVGRSIIEMKIITSADAAPVIVDITASAIGGEAELVASEGNLRFEDVAVGARSVKELSLTNTGNREVTISEMSVAGSDFSVLGGGQTRLSPGQIVSLQVAFNPRDTGERSGSLSVLANGASAAVQIPLSGAGAQASQSEVRLKWEESQLEAPGYRVYRASEPGGPYLPISASGVNSAEFTDTGVAAGHTYYYVVTSVDANNHESEFSEQITATVP